MPSRRCPEEPSHPSGNRYRSALRRLPPIWSTATPSSPNTVCDPPPAFSQAARGAAKRPAGSVAAPPGRYRGAGSARMAIAERPRPPAPRGKRISAAAARSGRRRLEGASAGGGGAARGTRAPRGRVPAASQRWEAIVRKPPRGMLGTCRGFSVLHMARSPSPNLLCQGRAAERCQDIPGANTAPFPTLPPRCVGTRRSVAKHRAGQDQKHQNHTNKS